MTAVSWKSTAFSSSFPFSSYHPVVLRESADAVAVLSGTGIVLVELGGLLSALDMVVSLIACDGETLEDIKDGIDEG